MWIELKVVWKHVFTSQFMTCMGRLWRNQGLNLSIKILFSLQELGPLGHPESFADDELHILTAFSLNHYLPRVGGADPLVHTKLTYAMNRLPAGQGRKSTGWGSRQGARTRLGEGLGLNQLLKLCPSMWLPFSQFCYVWVLEEHRKPEYIETPLVL